MIGDPESLKIILKGGKEKGMGKNREERRGGEGWGRKKRGMENREGEKRGE